MLSPYPHSLSYPPGNGCLPAVLSRPRRRHVLLRSKNKTVDVRHALIDYIERTEALDYKIN